MNSTLSPPSPTSSSNSSASRPSASPGFERPSASGSSSSSVRRQSLSQAFPKPRSVSRDGVAASFDAGSVRIVPDAYLSLFKEFLVWAATDDAGVIISARQSERLLEAMPLRSYLDSAGELTQQLALMAAAMQDAATGVRIGRRKWHFRFYHNVFVGSEAVDWLVAKGYATTRQKAVELGKLLVNHGFVVHVAAEHNFEDEHLFYRFREEQPAFALVPSADVGQGRGALLELVYHVHEDTVPEWVAAATPEELHIAYPAVMLWAKQHPDQMDEVKQMVLDVATEDESLMMHLVCFGKANGYQMDDVCVLPEAAELTRSLVVKGTPAKHVKMLQKGVDLVHPFTGQRAKSVVVEKEFVSDAKPAWLSFRGQDGQRMLPDVMAKHGDDLRKDLAVQLIFKVCDVIWRSAPVKWRLGAPSVRTYEVMVASEKSGFMEFVPGRTVKEVDKVGDWENVDLLRFAPSAVGSYVAGFVLGVRDRHSENWMLVEPEELMQIDFGYLLLENPGGFPLDTPRLTMQPHLVKLFKKQRGPSGGSLMEDFQHDLVTAYAVLREHQHAFTSFCKVVLSNVYPPAKVESFLWGRHAFRSAQDERRALEHFEGKVMSQLSTSVWRRAAKHALVKAYYAARSVI